MLRVKDDLRAAHRRPAHRLGIPPALVADRHAEFHAVGFEESSAAAGDVVRVLARVELVLGLIAFDSALGVDDVRRDLPARFGEPFRTEDRGDRIGSRRLRHGVEQPCVFCRAKRQDVDSDAAQPR
jgi:hypothetical protein